MSLSTISAAAAATREQSRQADGKFGEQQRAEASNDGQLGLASSPDIDLRSFTADGMTFRSASSGDGPIRTPEAIAVRFSADLDDQQLRQASAVFGYAHAKNLGPGLIESPPHRVDQRTFWMYVDAGSSPRSDPVEQLSHFEKDLRTFMVEGSPIRATNRTGAGTAGTRLVTGLGGRPEDVEVFYDSSAYADTVFVEDDDAYDDFDVEDAAELRHEWGVLKDNGGFAYNDAALGSLFERLPSPAGHRTAAQWWASYKGAEKVAYQRSSTPEARQMAREIAELARSGLELLIERQRARQ